MYALSSTENHRSSHEILNEGLYGTGMCNKVICLLALCGSAFIFDSEGLAVIELEFCTVPEFKSLNLFKQSVYT